MSDGLNWHYGFSRDGFRHCQFNIMLIIFKMSKIEKKAKFCHFSLFFACKYQNDDYICSSKFTGLFH